MPTVVPCPGCSSRIGIPENRLGQVVKCPKCGTKFQSPPAAHSDTSEVATAKPLPLPPPEIIPARTVSQPPTVPQPAVVVIHQERPESVRVTRQEVTVTHREQGSFGIGFGRTLGCLTAIAVFFGGGVFLFCCGGLGMLGLGTKAVSDAAEEIRRAELERKSQQPVSSEPRTEGREQATKPTGSAAATSYLDPITIGDFSLRVHKVEIAYVDLVEFGRNMVSKDKHFLVSLRLSTSNPNKRHIHKSWSVDPPLFRKNLASLKDDLGNSYRRVGFGSLTMIRGIERDAVVDSRNDVDDSVAFEVPVEGANSVVLELSFDDGELRGQKVTIRIPKSAWSRSAPQPTQETPTPKTEDRSKPPVTSSVPTKPKVDAKPAAPQSGIYGQRPAIVNEIQAEITSVRADRVSYTFQGKPEKSEAKFLIVTVKLSTKNPSKRYDHSAWYRPEAEKDNRYAQLVDQDGNRIDQHYFGPGTAIVGGTVNKTVSDGKDVVEVLAFRLPRLSAEKLTLTLANTNRADSDAFRFEIPRSAWE